MSKMVQNFLLNLNYDDLSSGLPAISVKYSDDSKTVVNPLDVENPFNLDIVRKMYQEGIINGDARQQMIPANTQCSLLHRDGQRCQNNIGVRTMVSPIVQQCNVTQSFPTQLYVVPSMVFTPDASTRTKHFSF